MPYSIVITSAGTATAYTTKAAALTAYAALTPAETPANLFLEPAPSKELGLGKVDGTWTDAYGVVRVVGTGAVYTPPEEE